MKKLLALLFIASTMLISCEQNGVNEPDKPKDAPSFTFMEGTDVSPTIGYVGGELAFSFISNCSWTVEENVDWVNISPTSGNQGNHTLAISVAKNTTGEERLSKITILYGVDSQVVINLTQEANEVFETDSEGNYIVEADGGTVAVKVTTNLEYDVIIPDEASAWLSLADTRVIRKETLTFNIAKNEDNKQRTAVVNLCAKSGDILQIITIKQDKSTSITCANNEIIYTTKYGYPIELNITDSFGGNLMSHTYENGYGRIIFDNDVICIPEKAFKECTTLTEVILPNSLSKIRSFAFYNCCNLASVTIPESVTEIGAYAFYGCSSVETFVFKHNFPPKIDYTSFLGIDNLQISISYETINELLGFWPMYCILAITNLSEEDSEILNKETTIIYYTTIDNQILNVYPQNDNLVIHHSYNEDTGGIIVFSSAVISLQQHAFKDCVTLKTIDLPKCIESIEEEAFENCENLECIIIPNGVNVIKRETFYNCFALKDVILPPITTIEFNAFGGCKSFSTINLPHGLINLDKWAFNGCNNLLEVSLPDTLISMGEGAFIWCTSLKSIVIPKNVTSIGRAAFGNCNSLREVYCMPQSAPTITNGEDLSINNYATIYVPIGSLDDYKTAVGWSKYSSQIKGYDFENNPIY